MKTKITLLSTAILLLIVVWYLSPSSTEQAKLASQQASLGSIKCTVAKFLLSDVDTTRQIAPLFDNLGQLHFGISTENKEAQAFFDQGIRLTYAFNHAEAHRSFMEAARLDPSSAMSYWGQAYTLGPNINDPMPDTQRKLKAYEATQKALERLSAVSPRERALIEALNTRYSADRFSQPEYCLYERHGRSGSKISRRRRYTNALRCSRDEHHALELLG